MTNPYDKRSIAINAIITGSLVTNMHATQRLVVEEIGFKPNDLIEEKPIRRILYKREIKHIGSKGRQA